MYINDEVEIGVGAPDSEFKQNPPKTAVSPNMKLVRKTLSNYNNQSILDKTKQSMSQRNQNSSRNKQV